MINFWAEEVFESFVDGVAEFIDFFENVVFIVGFGVSVEGESGIFFVQWNELFYLFRCEVDDFGVKNRVVVVWVEAWIVSHGDDFSGFRFHDNHLAAVSVVGFDSLCEFFFDDHLDRAVDCKCDVRAVYCGFDDAVADCNMASGGIDFGLENTFFPF